MLFLHQPSLWMSLSEKSYPIYWNLFYYICEFLTIRLAVIASDRAVILNTIVAINVRQGCLKEVKNNFWFENVIFQQIILWLGKFITSVFLNSAIRSHVGSKSTQHVMRWLQVPIMSKKDSENLVDKSMPQRAGYRRGKLFGYDFMLELIPLWNRCSFVK